MKRKEFLQKSAVIAAVTLAAAVMEPGTVRAADIPDQEISAQVLDQSEKDASSAVVTASEEFSDKPADDETIDLETDAAQEIDSNTSEESSDTETTEDTLSNDEDTVSDTETTVDTSEVSDSEISSSSKISDAEADDPNAETSKTNDETAAQLQTPGWTTREDGTTGYQNEDGSLCADTIKEIDGKLYYFNEDGALVKNDIFRYDYSYYKASEDGSLFRSCWDGDSYYDQNGKQQRNCIIELDGKYYGFDNDGIKYSNTLFSRSGYHYADKDGTLLQNAWYDYNDETYYFGEDTTAYSDGSYEIDGKRYYFSSDGTLCKNTCIICDEKDADGNSIEVYYQAKENGELYTGWCRIYNELYYFDETGRGYDGFKTIDGKTYFFKCARLCIQETVEQDGVYYIAQSDGTLLEMKNNAWTVSEGKYYYLKDNTPLHSATAKIGSSWYGFNHKGQRYENETFSFWNNDTFTYYHAQEDGILSTNTWFEKENTYDKWFYLGADGASVRGLQTIDGKQYYFDSDCIRITNQSITVNEKKYFADSNGILCELPDSDGWVKIENEWYYAENGIILENCVRKIGDYYYGFGYYGKMYTDETFYEKNPSTGDYCYFCSDKDGHLKTNTWGTDRYSDYYFGEDGAASYNGVYTINGKLYAFANGKMQRNGTVTDHGKNYLCLSDGSLIYLSKAGWNYADSNWYYVKNDQLLKNCISKIGADYYAFDSDGKMQSNTLFILTGNDQAISCFAQNDGKLLTSTSINYGSATYYFDAEGKSRSGIQTIDGKQYYLVNGQKRKNEAFEADGSYYLADSTGQLKQVTGNNCWQQLGDKWYYIKDQHFLKNTVAEIEDKYYGFSSNGIMYTNTFFSFSTYDKDTYYAQKDGTLLRNKWYHSSDGRKVFYGDNCELTRSTYTATNIDGKLYYFNYDGLVTNKAFADADTNTNYAADGEGVLHELKNNQWNKVGEYWYYVKNFNIVKNSILNLGDAYYGFSSEGYMYTDTVFSITDEYGRTLSTYSADKDGKVRVNTAVDTWNTTYRFDADGQDYDGMITIQNVNYYFSDGELLKNRAFTYNNINYVAGADGRVLALPKKGWMQVDGRWYFVSNDGIIIRDQKIDIGNTTYLFHQKGYMITNNVFHTFDDYNKHHMYAADQSGKLVRNAWLKRPSNGTWIYCNADGEVLDDGIYTIQGKQYYFSSPGLLTGLLTDRIVTSKNVTYIADSDGVLHSINSNGWNHVGNYWYYFVNGKEVSDSIIKIGTAYYGFDSYGHMYDNTDFYYSDNAVSGYFRARSGGSLIFQNTVSIDTSSYSYDQNGLGLEGYHTVAGKQYYFIAGRKAANTAFFDESGAYYAADAAGKLYSLANNTWTKAGNYYYYVKDNVLQKNTVVLINGKYYAFDSYGRMCANQFFTSTYQNYDPEEYVPGTKGGYTLDPIIYRASASGALLCNQWYEDATGKYYFDGNGIGYEGTHWIDGKKYTFSQGKVIDPAPVKKASWEKDSKGWWYRHADGSYTKNGWEKINGKYYLFNASGYMLTGWQNVKGTWYYLKSDGAMVSKAWQQISGKWYYFEADGSMAGKGWHQIGGKWYYMYESGVMAVNTWIGNNYVDANGVWTKTK